MASNVGRSDNGAVFIASFIAAQKHFHRINYTSVDKFKCPSDFMNGSLCPSSFSAMHMATTESPLKRLIECTYMGYDIVDFS